MCVEVCVGLCVGVCVGCVLSCVAATKGRLAQECGTLSTKLQTDSTIIWMKNVLSILVFPPQKLYVCSFSSSFFFYNLLLLFYKLLAFLECMFSNIFVIYSVICYSIYRKPN